MIFNDASYYTSDFLIANTVKNIFYIIPYGFFLFNICSVNKISTFLLCI